MKETILCLDDEKTILVSLKSQLKKNFGNQFNYEFAESGDEALELIDDLVLDGCKVLLVLSDWLMPDMRGDDFLIEVHKKYPQIVKIMLTGQADKESVQKAINEANLYTCVSKPWKEEELMNYIKEGIKIL